MDAGQPLDVPLRLARGARRVFSEVLLQEFNVIAQFALRLGEPDFQSGRQAALVVFTEMALDGASAQSGKPGDLYVGDPFALQPEDFEFLLNVRVRVAETLLADDGQVVLGEMEASHGGTFPSPEGHSLGNSYARSGKTERCHLCPLAV
jgi:hypothetical protein